MKIKTSELDGAALDWAVAEAERLAVIESFGPSWRNEFSPSTRWSQGGVIIEREKISMCAMSRNWVAESFLLNEQGLECVGQTPLIAAMRCYVASKLGEEVEVPDELLQGESKCK